MKEISKLHMAIIDAKYKTPSERAQEVFDLLSSMQTFLQDNNKKEGKPEHEGVPSNWDILAFAIEYAGMQVIALGGPEEHIAELSRWFYSIHYSNPRELYGNPDRKAKEDGETPMGVPSDG